MDRINFLRDIVLRGGEAMINFNKIADILLKETNNPQKLEHILNNYLFGKLTPEELNNKNFIKLKKIVFDKIKSGGSVDRKTIDDKIIRNLGNVIMKYNKKK